MNNSCSGAPNKVLSECTYVCVYVYVCVFECQSVLDPACVFVCFNI